MATFRFSKETPPDSMFSDIQTLNKFQNKQFGTLVEYALEFLADPGKSSKLMEQLQEFAEQNGVNATALKNVFKSLLSIPSSALRKSLTANQLKEDLTNLDMLNGSFWPIIDYPQILKGLAEDKAEYFCQQWNNSLAALSRSALGQTLMVNQLTDMEWKFGVTAASSEMDKVGNTFLQLKLVINTGNGTKNTYMELTLPQFYSFLHEMEKAKASLELLS